MIRNPQLIVSLITLFFSFCAKKAPEVDKNYVGKWSVRDNGSCGRVFEIYSDGDGSTYLDGEHECKKPRKGKAKISNNTLKIAGTSLGKINKTPTLLQRSIHVNAAMGNTFVDMFMVLNTDTFFRYKEL